MNQHDEEGRVGRRRRARRREGTMRMTTQLRRRLLQALEKIICPDQRSAPTAEAAAKAERASYHFQKYVLTLPGCTYEELFSREIGKRRVIETAPRPSYGLFAHEYTHFLQAVTTVLGQRILLNWIAVSGTIAQQFHAPYLLKVPAEMAVSDHRSQEAAKVWRSYINEANALVGTQLALRPDSEVAKREKFEVYTYEFRHPADRSESKGVALVVPGKNGKLVGVPLQGDAFLEGHAQAVQWRVDGVQRPLNERLRGRIVDPVKVTNVKDVYYTAIILAVAAKLPKLPTLETTALLCDVALCSKKPGESFAHAFDLLRATQGSLPTGWAGLEQARRKLHQLPYCAEGASFIRDQIESFGSMFDSASEGSFGAFARKLIWLMQRANLARDHDPAVFIDPDYGDGWLERVVPVAGGPPIFLGNDDHFVGLHGDGELHRAFFWSRGTFEVLDAVMRTGFQAGCPIGAAGICNFEGRDARCERGELLDAPVIGSRTCYIGNAGHTMLLHGRKWARA